MARKRQFGPGTRFGKLVVLADAPFKSTCQCDCGEVKEFLNCNLMSGKSCSCGCTRRASGPASASFTHGKTKTAEYKIWGGMVSRCENPKVRAYPHYGGRGIKVCDRWRNDFTAFLADMGLRPSPEHSIDRIDSNGNYTHLNCRWATAADQAHNRRNNALTWEKVDEIRRLSAEGKTVREITEIVGAGDCAVRSVVKGLTWKRAA